MKLRHTFTETGANSRLLDPNFLNTIMIYIIIHLHLPLRENFGGNYHLSLQSTKDFLCQLNITAHFLLPNYPVPSVAQ
jgi:hypothetical protein